MANKRPKKKKTAGDIVLSLILVAAICVFCYAAFNLFHIYTEYKKGTDEYNNLVQMAVTEKEPDAEIKPAEEVLKPPMDIIRLSRRQTMTSIFILHMREIIILQVRFL